MMESMPLTLPAHPAPALWLKLRFPARWSGTALVAGAVAPDLEYLIRAEPYREWGHSLPGLFLFSLPAGLLLCVLLVGLLVQPLALHLPREEYWGIHEYWRIAEGARRPGYLLALLLGVAAGAATHLAWDSFTHHEGEALRLLGLSQSEVDVAGSAWPLHRLLWLAFSAAGSAYVLLRALPLIRRERLLDAWWGPATAPPPLPTLASHLALWGIPAAAALAAAALAVQRLGLPDLRFGPWLLWLTGLEALRAAAVALLPAALLCRRLMRSARKVD